MILGEYRCQVKGHKTISIVRTNREAPGMKYRIGYRYWPISASIYQIIGISVKTHIGATLHKTSLSGVAS